MLDNRSNVWPFAMLISFGNFQNPTTIPTWKNVTMADRRRKETKKNDIKCDHFTLPDMS